MPSPFLSQKESKMKNTSTRNSVEEFNQWVAEFRVSTQYVDNEIVHLCSRDEAIYFQSQNFNNAKKQKEWNSSNWSSKQSKWTSRWEIIQQLKNSWNQFLKKNF